jgi:hypothetical protein
MGQGVGLLGQPRLGSRGARPIGGSGHCRQVLHRVAPVQDAHRIGTVQGDEAELRNCTAQPCGAGGTSRSSRSTAAVCTAS